MQMISDEQNSSLIRWTRDGKAFVITNRKKLAETLLPQYFKKQTIKYRSFTRRLNRWGFVCCISSQDTCIYSHPVSSLGRHYLYDWIAQHNFSNTHIYSYSLSLSIPNSCFNATGLISVLTWAHVARTAARLRRLILILLLWKTSQTRFLKWEPLLF